MPIAIPKPAISSRRGVAVKSPSSSAMSRGRCAAFNIYGIPYNYDIRDPMRRAGRRVQSGGVGAASDVRASLDAFRRIVQALRMNEGARGAARRVGSAQLFALQQIAEHPGASINDIAALTFTHQSSVSVVVQRLVRRGLAASVVASDDRR